VDDRPVQDGEQGGHPVTEAFDDFFDAYEQRIFNLVYRLVGDYEDAADLTSDTFVRALRGYEKFRGDAHTYTWLYRIAVNLCKNYFRQQQHRSRVHSFSLDAPLEARKDSARARSRTRDRSRSVERRRGSWKVRCSAA